MSGRATFSDWSRRESPDDPPEPELGSDESACSSCGRLADAGECEGFEGYCDGQQSYCSECAPETEDGETRCERCEEQYMAAVDAHNEGHWYAPLPERATSCAVCGRWAHRDPSPGTWCSECSNVACGACQRRGDDGVLRCEPCAKAKVGL